MILVLGKNPGANLLHVLLGHETDFWMQLHGAAAMDLTPVLHQLEAGKPVVLHITRCDDEQAMAHQLQSMSASGGHYPFVPPTFVFTPKSAPEPVVAPAAPPAAAKPIPQKATRCQRCLTSNVPLVPELQPSICYKCAQIDLAMARENFSVVPPARVPRPPADGKSPPKEG